VVGPGKVWLELGPDEELAEKEKGAETLVEQERVLPAPAEPGPLRPVAVHDRGRVDERAAVEGRVQPAAVVQERVELVPEHPVIIFARRVAGDADALGTLCLGRTVDEPDRDHRAATRHELARIDPLLEVTRHPAHRAVMAPVEPFGQQGRLGDGLGASHPHQGEAQAGGLVLDAPGQLGGGHPGPPAAAPPFSASASFTRPASAAENPGTLAISSIEVARIRSTERK